MSSRTALAVYLVVIPFFGIALEASLVRAQTPTAQESLTPAEVAAAAQSVMSALMANVDESKTVWAALKAAHEGTEQYYKVLDGLDAANGALDSGEVPADAGIARVRDFVTNEQVLLSTLAHKSASAWLTDSGINSFDPSTIPAAEAYLDDWSQKMTTLKELIEDLLPLKQTVETVFDVAGVAKVATTSDTTLALGNGMAISDAIFPRLGGCSTEIDVILNNLQAALSVVQASAVAPRHSLQSATTAQSPPTAPGPILLPLQAPVSTQGRNCPAGAYLLPNGLCTDAINDKANRSYRPPAQQPATQPQGTLCANGYVGPCGCGCTDPNNAGPVGSSK